MQYMRLEENAKDYLDSSWNADLVVKRKYLRGAK